MNTSEDAACGAVALGFSLTHAILVRGFLVVNESQVFRESAAEALGVWHRQKFLVLTSPRFISLPIAIVSAALAVAPEGGSAHRGATCAAALLAAALAAVYAVV